MSINHTLELEQRLTHFRDSNGIGRSKGKLSVVLHVTRVATDKGLPLDSATLRTPGKGQVLGLSRSAIQAILNDIKIQHHSASTADAPTERQGDFILDKIAIHVTTAPTTNLMVKCKENLEAGYRPIVVTLHDRVPAAEGNAQIEGIEDRVDILAVEQFLATNLHELSGFQDAERHASIAELVAEYNKIIDNYETDPSLHIQISA